MATFATEPLPNILRIIVNFNLRFGILKIPTFFINHFLINGSNMALARNVSSIVNSMKDDVITTRAKTALSVNVLSNLGEISVPALIIEAKISLQKQISRIRRAAFFVTNVTGQSRIFNL